MTHLSIHIQQWANCTLCPYHQVRRNIVLGKGDIPCDVLFIGEAPGDSEDVTGKPFVGKAGKLLDRIINRAFGPPDKRKYRLAFNNVVACIPKVGDEKEEPDSECVELCKPRISEFIEIANPRMIIAVGKVAANWLEPQWKDRIEYNLSIKVVKIQHPASITRMPEAQQPLAVQQCVVILSTAIHEILEGGDDQVK